jgi:hypothetical protein
MTAMRINHQVVVFDAADLAAESRFWAGVLGGTVDTALLKSCDGSRRARKSKFSTTIAQ